MQVCRRAGRQADMQAGRKTGRMAGKHLSRQAGRGKGEQVDRGFLIKGDKNCELKHHLLYVNCNTTGRCIIK